MSIERIQNSLVDSIANQLGSGLLERDELNTLSKLSELGSKNEWNRIDWEFVNFFSKKIEINSKLYDSYKSNGRKSTTAKPIGDDASELVLVILLRAVFQASAKGESLVVIGKRFNAIFKLAELTSPDWLSETGELWQELLNHWKSFSDRVVEENQYPISLEPKAEEIETAKRESKTIPLTVLFYEGPNSRAYLETIFSLGLRPQKIIN